MDVVTLGAALSIMKKMPDTAASSAAAAEAAQAAAEAAQAAAEAAAEQAEGAIEVDDTLSVEGRAADAKITGDEITSLKSALTLYDEGKKQFPGTYQYATLNQSGEIVERTDHTRAAIETYYTATEGDTLTVCTGFAAVLCEYNSSNVLLDRGIKVAGTYTLNANSKYRVSPYYVTQQVILNLSEVAFAVIVKTNVEKHLEAIDEDEAGVEAQTEHIIFNEKTIIPEYDEGRKRFPGVFEYATLDTSGEYTPNPAHKEIATADYYMATDGDVLTVKEGFSCILCEYNNDYSLTSRGLKTPGDYSLTAGSLYRIAIYNTTDTVIPYIYSGQYAVLITSKTEKRFDDINNRIVIEKADIQTEYNSGYVSITEKGIHTTASSAEYKYSNLIFLKKGCRVSVTFHDTNSAVAIISTWESDGSFLRGISVGNSQTGEQTASYVAEYDCYIRVSARYDFIATIEKIIVTKTDILKNSVSQEDYGYLLNSFLKIGAVGDSLASGACASNNGTSVTHDIPEHSWLQYMARYYGFTGINFTKGGCYTRGWLDDARYDYQGWTKAQLPDNKCNAYFIGLGANDMGVIQAGNFTLGTTADVGTDADSFYGCYSKIITNLKTIQPKAKFFLFTLTWLYTVMSPYDTMVEGINNAIRYIAGQFDNCYVIDLQNDDFYYSADVTGNKRMGHYNAISYNMQAMHLAKLIGNYMHGHQDEFNQLEFIGTDWSWTD